MSRSAPSNVAYIKNLNNCVARISILAKGSKSIRNVDLNLLVIFEAVYSTGNISNAARQLALTQPAVSNAISRLRDHFDDPLFVRSGRGVKPTNRSQQMIESVRGALRLIRHELEGGPEFDLATYKRSFRIVVVDALEPVLMPPVLRAITKEAPNISIESRPPATTDVIGEIMAGTLDLACYTFLASVPGLVIRPIHSVEYVIVSRRNHPAIGKKLDKATFLNLGHVALIRELRNHVSIDRDITTRGGTRRIVFSVNKVWSVPSIVASTDLVSILPRDFAERVSKNFDIDIHEPPVPISGHEMHMMWHEKNNDDPGHRWLRETLMMAAQETALPPSTVAKSARRRSRGSAG